MRNADAIMRVDSLEEGPLRENMQKLNRLFRGGSFAFDAGVISFGVNNLLATPISAQMAFHRVGNLVTLQLLESLTTTAKANTSDPSSLTSLPQNLRPVANVIGGWRISVSGTAVFGFIQITQAGVIHWSRVTGSAWTSAAEATVYPSTISYLGS